MKSTDMTTPSGQKILSVQSLEYANPFSTALERQGVDYAKTDLEEGGYFAITSYRYKSPRFGDCYAYEYVVRYDVDGYEQDVIITDKPLDDWSMEAMRMICSEWYRRERAKAYVVNMYRTETEYRSGGSSRRVAKTISDVADAIASIKKFWGDYDKNPQMLFAVSAPAGKESWYEGGNGWAMIDDGIYDRGSLA